MTLPKDYLERVYAGVLGKLSGFISAVPLKAGLMKRLPNILAKSTTTSMKS